jgi:hypothetical protein
LVLSRQQRAEVERSAVETMESVRHAVDAELGQLVAAAQTLATSHLSDPGRLQLFHEAAGRVVDSHAGWGKIALFDRSGRPVVDTEQAFGAILVENPDAPGFERVASRLEPVIGSVVPTSVPGERWFVVHVPVLRDRTLSYVLSVSAAPSLMLSVIAGQTIPPGSVVSIFDSRGTHVVTSPPSAQIVGPARGLLAPDGHPESPHAFRRFERESGEAFYAASGHSRQTGWSVALALPAVGVDTIARGSYGVLVAGAARSPTSASSRAPSTRRRASIPSWPSSAPG